MKWYTRPNWAYTFAILSGTAIAIAHSQLLFNVVEIPSWNHLWYAFKTKHHHEFVRWFVFVFFPSLVSFQFSSFFRSLGCIKVHAMHYRLCMWVSMKCFIIFKYRNPVQASQNHFSCKTAQKNLRCVFDILIFHFSPISVHGAQCAWYSITTPTCSNW